MLQVYDYFIITMKWWLLFFLLWGFWSSSSFEFKLSCFDDVESCYPNAEEDIFNYAKNKHIAFIGDSLTRYQYLSLVYMLRHRHIPSMDMIPTIFEEHHPSFGNFNAFYQFTKDMLSPNEVCDCFRNTYPADVPSNSFENHYYRDPVNNITVTYLWYIFYGHGHWTFEESLNKDITKHYPHMDLNPAPNAWKLTLCNISSMYLGTFDPKPDVIVFNVGRWGQQLTSEEIACAVFDMAQVTEIVIWKTTTFSRLETDSGIQFNSSRGLHMLDNDNLITPYEGTALSIMNTSWTGQLKDDRYYNHGDDLHFKANVYALLNIQLMEIIEARRKELADSEES